MSWYHRCRAIAGGQERQLAQLTAAATREGSMLQCLKPEFNVRSMVNH
jgi:hypothetical protein